MSEITRIGDASVALYTYRGHPPAGEATGKVKAHHAERTGTDYDDLVGRSLGRDIGGGQAELSVVVVEQGGD